MQHALHAKPRQNVMPWSANLDGSTQMAMPPRVVKRPAVKSHMANAQNAVAPTAAKKWNAIRIGSMQMDLPATAARFLAPRKFGESARSVSVPPSVNTSTRAHRTPST